MHISPVYEVLEHLNFLMLYCPNKLSRYYTCIVQTLNRITLSFYKSSIHAIMKLFLTGYGGISITIIMKSIRITIVYTMVLRTKLRVFMYVTVAALRRSVLARIHLQ